MGETVEGSDRWTVDTLGDALDAAIGTDD